MRNVTVLLAMALSAFTAHNAFASDYVLDSSLSSISFATIKKQFVVEPASINTLSGQLKDNGQFQISVDLKGISTGVPIRDARLNEIFFDSMTYPMVSITGSVDAGLLSGEAKQVALPVKVTMHSQTQSVTFPVVVMPAGDHIMVSSYAPVVIGGSDFGIPADNLNALSATVGDISISDRVPVTLTLMFRK
ncbi:YceI family protein [Vibrio fluvialis]|uniref:YceI family protein n=1 Tax=Vibrio fluvialis TaxID=676 RepID=UPI001C9CCA14|nr:YceI family protein [Vibrio fluvialis]